MGREQEDKSRESCIENYAKNVHGHWFKCPFALPNVSLKPNGKGPPELLGYKKAFLLAYLINHSLRVDAERNKDGWFYCTVETIARETTIDRNFQTRTLDEFKNAGLVQTERRGRPPKRWVRINWPVLDELLSEAATRMLLKKTQIESD